MTPRAKADELVHEYRLLFMEEGEEYGEEILVSVLSRKCAKIAVELRLKAYSSMPVGSIIFADRNESFWNEVLKEIELLNNN